MQSPPDSTVSTVVTTVTTVSSVSVVETSTRVLVVPDCGPDSPDANMRPERERETADADEAAAPLARRGGSD